MMTDFSDLLRLDAVLMGAVVASKKALFQQIAVTANAVAGVDPRLAADRLAARERLGSTGFGGGVGIPHAKLPGIVAPVGVFIRLAQPFAYQAVDDLPVDLVFALLSPELAGSTHLKALARISRRMRDRGFLAKLHGAGSPDALFALFTTAESRNAA